MYLNRIVIKTEPSDTEFIDDVKIDEQSLSEFQEQSTTNISINKHPPHCEIIRSPADVNEIVKEEPIFDQAHNKYEILELPTDHRIAKTKAKRKSKNELRTYQCYLCNYSPRIINNLKRHFIRCHSGNRSIQCNECPKRFSMKSSLTAHQVIHRNDRKLFTCQYCKRKFNKKCNLDRHHGACVSLLFDKQMRLLFGKCGQFECYLCKLKKFKNFGEINIHLVVTHTVEAIFNCNVCQRKFNSQKKLVACVRSHTTNKQFECEQCLKTFTNKRNLKRHNRLHTSIGLFECKNCSKKLTTKYALQTHERLHTGLKPFSCEICKETFGRKDTLNRHKQNRHN